MALDDVMYAAQYCVFGLSAGQLTPLKGWLMKFQTAGVSDVVPV